jgi:hypothetical protein
LDATIGKPWILGMQYNDKAILSTIGGLATRVHTCDFYNIQLKYNIEEVMHMHLEAIILSSCSVIVVECYIVGV